MNLKNVLKIAGLIISLQPLISAKNYTGPTKLKNKHVDHVSILGPAKLKNVTAQSLRITGPLKFESLRVSGDTKITGPIEKSSNGQFENLTITGPSRMNNVSCTNLSATGPATLTNTDVRGNATLVGSLTTTTCTFKTITITADNINFNDTKTGTVLVKKNNPGSGFFSWFFELFGYNSPQEYSETMTLFGTTTIKGNLTFESGKGHLIIMPDAQVTGTIKGAMVEKR